MWSGPKQQKFIFSVLEAGILRYGCQQVGSNGSSLQMAVFLLCLHDAECVCVCLCKRESSSVSSWKKESEVAQSCLTLCDFMGCNLPGFSVHGIFQARVLEWAAISFFRRSSQPRDWTQVSRIVGRRFTVWATREVSVSSYRGPNPKSISFMTPCEPHDHPRAPSPNTIILGFRASIW